MRPDPLLTDALYQQVFLRAGLPMALHSADRRFLHANDAMVDLLGYSLEELQVMTVMDVVHPEERDTSARFAAQWLAGIGRESRLFGRIVRKDGGVVSARIRKYVLDPGGPDGALVALAVIDRIDEEHTSEYASRHDDLTGLLNRRGFREALAVSYPENLPSMLAMLDVDHLKCVNDRFGHAAGDEVIVAVARTLALALPDDGVLCRWSGDEFVAFVPRPTADDFAPARLRALAYRARVPVSGGFVVPEVSVGITRFDPGTDRLDDALRRADAEMYRAKQGARAAGDARAEGLPTAP